MAKEINMFVIYAREDKDVKLDLLRHLNQFKEAFNLSIWHDDQIEPGQLWKPHIESRLNFTDVFLLLVSVDFMNSQFIKQTEFKAAIDRHKENKSVVIPVIIDYCQWDIDFTLIDYKFNIKELQVLPDEGKPVGEWHTPDQAYNNVAAGVRKVLTSIQNKRKQIDKTEKENEKETAKLNAELEEATKLKALEDKRLSEEAEIKRKAEEDKRLAEEAEIKRKAEENKQLAEEAKIKKKAEEDKRLADEAEAKRKAEEDQRLKDEAEAKRKAEENKRLAEEAEAKRKAEEEAAKRKAEEDAAAKRKAKAKQPEKKNINKLVLPGIIVAVLVTVVIVVFSIQKPDPDPEPPTPVVTTATKDSIAWKNAQAEVIIAESIPQKINIYDSYLNNFPDGKYIENARDRIVELQIEQDSIDSIQREAAFANLKIGDTYDGGIIFEIDHATKKGKIAHLTDSNKMPWKTAMDIHEQLGEGWRLPSFDELKLMYQTIGKGATNTGQFKDDLYWSSTSYNTSTARLLRFSDANTSFYYSKDNPNRNYLVRAIKDFSL